MIKEFFPTKQDFIENPFASLTALWVISSALSAILFPRLCLIFLILLGLSILGISAAKKRLPPLTSLPLTGAFVAIFMLASLSLFWTVAPDQAFSRLPLTGFTFLWGLLALGAVQQATAKIAQGTLSLTAVVYAIALAVITIEINFDYLIYRAIIGAIKGREISENLSGNLINQSALLIALYLWPVCLALWLRGFRTAAIAFFIVAFVIFLPSPAESVALALICGTLACGVTALFPRWMKIWFSTVIVIMMIAMPIFPIHLLSLLLEHDKIVPLSGLVRLEIWDYVAGKIFEQPFVGYGMEASRVLEGDTVSKLLPEISRLPHHPHNGFLQIWLELGLAGYIILGLFCLWIVQKISQLETTGMAFATGLFVCGLSLFSTAYGMWQFWLNAVEFSAAVALLLALKLQNKTQPVKT